MSRASDNARRPVNFHSHWCLGLATFFLNFNAEKYAIFEENKDDIN